MWPQLGDGDPIDGEEPGVCVHVLSGNSPLMHMIIVDVQFLQIWRFSFRFHPNLLFYPGSAVPVGKELVPRTLLPDSALRQERPIHTRWRNVGGNGKSYLGKQHHFIRHKILTVLLFLAVVVHGHSALL